MNLHELQAELRHFAAERDWQPLHTPKNLSTALMVEAAELAGIFQWMAPEESRVAHETPASKQRIGEEVADVLLYLLQIADHCRIDIAPAVRDRLARNALKHPVRQTIARVDPQHASVPGMHVLLDYENVQPTEGELRAMVPQASQVWVFHGPHQRQVEQRFASFGAAVTAVPISRTGKNALDFHLSFYMGYIASRNPAATIVVVANDQGYAPMLEHAMAMGFAVRQLGHGPAKAAAKKAVARKVPVRKAAVGQPARKQAPAKKQASVKKAAAAAAKKAAAKKTAPAKTKKVKASAQRPAVGKGAVAVPGAAAIPASPPSSVGSAAMPADMVAKIADNLRKMGDKRPVKPASLRRALKSFLGAETGDTSIEAALSGLIAAGVVAAGAEGDVSYPGFAKPSGP